MISHDMSCCVGSSISHCHRHYTLVFEGDFRRGILFCIEIYQEYEAVIKVITFGLCVYVCLYITSKLDIRDREVCCEYYFVIKSD